MYLTCKAWNGAVCRTGVNRSSLPVWQTQFAFVERVTNTSLSKCVVKFIVDNAAGGWPDGYRGLFGSIDDEALCEPKELILRVRWQSGGRGAGLIEQG